MKHSVISAYLHENLKDCQLIDDNHICGRILFTPDFPGFDGHFPGFKLVPGVCLVETVRCTFEKALQTRVQTVKIKSCRFRAQVVPDTAVEIKITVKELAPAHWQLQSEIMTGEVSALRVSLEVEKEG